MPLFGRPISELSNTSTSAIQTAVVVCTLPTPPTQLQAIENDLINAVDQLKKCKRIFRTPLTLEEMLNPVEEREVSDSPYRFEGGDAEIIAQVQKELERERGEIIEVDSSESEEDELEEKGATISKVMKMCKDLECLSLHYGSADTSLTLTRELHQFCIHLRRETVKSLKQMTLESWVQVGTCHICS